MPISLTALGGSLLDAKEFGEVWKPKAQKLRVGSELCPLTATGFSEKGKMNIIVADGDDVRFTSRGLFDAAKSVAQAGFQPRSFRIIDRDLLKESGLAAVDTHLVQETEKYTVWFANGTLSIAKKGEPKQLPQTFKITGDSRLSWDADGGPVLTSGNGALTTGKLKALGNNDILIRTSGVDVEAGSGTTVLNCSGKGGTFSGGSNVSYLGTYEDAVITGGAGETRFGGYFGDTAIRSTEGRGVFSGVFERATLESGDASDIFSGYFSASAVEAGDGANVFSGMFLDSCTLNGGAGNDSFYGRFIDSIVNGGAGNDVFGSTINLNDIKPVTSRRNSETYQGFETDFVDSAVDAGEGDDSFSGGAFGGTILLGEGNDKAYGMFSHVLVDAGNGNDELSAIYSNTSVFETGEGDNAVALSASKFSTVRTGTGANRISLGYNTNGSTSALVAGFGSNDPALSNTTWQTPEEVENKARPQEFGELATNRVDASQGENLIHVNNGRGTHTLKVGTRRAKEKTTEQESSFTDKRAAGPLSPKPDGTSLNPASVAAPEASPSADILSEAPAGTEGKKQGKTPVIDRYALHLGDAPSSLGPAAAEIITGTGETVTFRGIWRTEQEEPRKGPFRITRRNHGAGAYEWVSSLQ